MIHSSMSLRGAPRLRSGRRSNLLIARRLLRHSLRSWLATTVILFLAISSFAQDSPQDIPSIPDFTKNDKVLILAPHPDDETIGTAGVIQRAIKGGASVYVACYTNGDANELAFIIYEKRFTFRKGEFIHMGEIRRKETMAAMKSLGVNENNIFFLGYPDFGTMEIMLKFWGATRPYRSLFARVTNVPYKENLSYGALYIGENILEDIENILLHIRPTKIFVSSPMDTNGDHQSLFLFLRVALWDLSDKLKDVQVYPYLVHCIGWPKPRGFHPELPLALPAGFVGTQAAWKKLDLTRDEIETKNKVFNFYKSQIPYNPQYLPTFARKNELFGDYSVVTLKESASGPEINWQDSHGPEDDLMDFASLDKSMQVEDDDVFLSYAKKDANLYIRFKLSRKITKAVKSRVYLLPYKKEKDFSDMPKIRVIITRNSVIVYNKRRKLPLAGISMNVTQDNIIVKLPLASLGNPYYILARGKIYTDAAPSDLSSWRVLKLE